MPGGEVNVHVQNFQNNHTTSVPYKKLHTGLEFVTKIFTLQHCDTIGRFYINARLALLLRCTNVSEQIEARQ